MVESAAQVTKGLAAPAFVGRQRELE
ncbi:MAG: hypothetical protein QOI66_3428, partial [Myxococcales bacterium]|nr:hypothetical protein [Myxococcales bacterium]